ncbi:MAG: flagellar hook-basal body complex protein [Planctomycetota bacterium]
MGLASALSTALTGLSAAETQIDVIGNNLANSQTVGFKSSRAVFATQFAQTLSLGATPTADNGGTNPRQVGRGVQVAEIAQDFNQGTIQISSNTSDMAIQGDGFFIVEGADEERFFTRNGVFRLNSANELTNATGQRLLGFGVDDRFRIEPGDLKPLEIPVGTEAVAKATETVTMEGTLTPLGETSTTAEIIESIVLSDAKVPRADAADVRVSNAPLIDAPAISVNTGGAGSLVGGTYRYSFAFVDSSGRESTPSSALDVTVGSNAAVQIGNLPSIAPDSGYTGINVYRSSVGGTAMQRLGPTITGGSFVDDGSLVLTSDSLNDQTLSGNYSYVVTYHRNGEVESRPSVLLGPTNVIDGRVTINNLPTPPNPGPGGEFPAYDQIRIYRNLANDQNNFYLVDTVSPGQTYTDSKSDAEIADLTNPNNQTLNREGPTINSNTLLVDVVKRSGNSYENIFREGTLTFNGRKGGRTLGNKPFSVTSGSTVGQLLEFIERASGLQNTSVGAVNPVPLSQNTLPGESGTLAAGGYIVNGRLRLVSNTGEANALEIDLSSFRMEDTAGEVTSPNLSFGTVQEATGTSASTDFVVYDSLGVPVNVRVTTTLESTNSEETVYRWYADSADNALPGETQSAVGTGLIRFDGNGNYLSTSNDRIAIGRSGSPAESPLEFVVDFSSVSGLATPEASLAATRQDGSEPGVLNTYVVGEDGMIRGVFSNGVTRDLGQIQLARFANPIGLESRGLNLYATGINSGLAITGGPGENGIGTVVGGALELSNTDIGRDLVDLVLASTQYRGNSRVITTSQQLLDELLNLRR